MITVKNTNYSNYDTDIRELLQAFYPGCEIGTGDAEGVFLQLDIDELMKGVKIPEGRLHRKSVIKKRLYEYLSALTGRKLPWGTLTGIKPVKLADMILSEGCSPEEADQKILEDYLVSDTKRRLMLDIAVRERRCFPFCRKKVIPFISVFRFVPAAAFIAALRPIRSAVLKVRWKNIWMIWKRSW